MIKSGSHITNDKSDCLVILISKTEDIFNRDWQSIIKFTSTNWKKLSTSRLKYNIFFYYYDQLFWLHGLEWFLNQQLCLGALILLTDLVIQNYYQNHK